MKKTLVLAAVLAVAGIAQAQTSASAPAAIAASAAKKAKAAPASASAPAPAATSAAKKALVARLLKLQQPALESMARTLAEQPAMMLMQQAGPALQRLPAERRDAVAREIEADMRKYVEEAVPLVRDRALKLAPTTIGTVLEERLSESELKQVIELLESPGYRKLQSLAPEMQRAIGEKLVTETRAAVEPKVQALQQSVGKRLGLTPAGAGASAPGK
jgi:hypothetical protein